MRYEDALQINCIEWASLFVPAPPDGPWINAVNPVPSKTKATGRLCKRMGAKAGAADIECLWYSVELSRRPFLIEMKDPGDPRLGRSPGRLKDSQREQFPLIEAAGIKIYTCTSLDEFQAALAAEGVPMTARIAA